MIELVKELMVILLILFVLWTTCFLAYRDGYKAGLEANKARLEVREVK